jgi:hypothetical protein
VDTPSAENWTALIKGACLLWLRLSAADRDRQLASTGTAIHYAVDTDLIKLFASPYDMRRYADLLGILDDTSMTALGRCLSHHVFFGAPGKADREPSLLVPPLDEEILEVYAAVRRDAAKEIASARIQVGDLLGALQRASRKTDAKEIVELVLARNDLFNVLFGERFTGHVNELDRMNQLFSEKRLKPVVSDNRFPQPQEFDLRALRNRSEQWFDVLRRKKNPKRSSVRISRDAEAMSFVEWTNVKLAQSGSRHAIRLVTGDAGLSEIAIQASGEFGPAAHEFVRDPRIFVAEFPIALRNETYDIRSWLRVFLAPLASGEDLDVASVRRFALGEGDDFRSVVIDAFARHHGLRRLDEARMEWTNFAQQSSLVYGMRVKSDTDAARGIVRLLWSDDMNRVRRAIDDRLISVLGDLSATSAVAGIFLSARQPDKREILIPSSRPGAKSQSPMLFAIKFRDPQTRDKYFSSLKKALIDGNIDGMESLNSRDKIYTGHLFYAIFFASLGDWAATANLSRVANLIVENSQMTKQDSLAGHEAAYLLAVAVRHSSRTFAEFREAINALKKAEQRLSSENETERDLRFVSEKIAQHLFIHNYLIFSPRVEGEEIPNIPSLRECLNDLQSLLSEAKNVSESEELKLPLLSQISTNILVTFLLLKHKLDVQEPELAPIAREVFNVLQDTTKKVRVRPLTPLLFSLSRFFDTVLALSAWSLEDDPARKASLARTARELCRVSMKAPETPYDVQRFSFFCELLEPDISESNGKDSELD